MFSSGKPPLIHALSQIYVCLFRTYKLSKRETSLEAKRRELRRELRVRREMTYMVFIEFEEAFDRVDKFFGKFLQTGVFKISD